MPPSVSLHAGKDVPRRWCLALRRRPATHGPLLPEPGVAAQAALLRHGSGAGSPSARRLLAVRSEQQEESRRRASPSTRRRLPVVDVCLHARRVRCHGHIVETVPRVSTGNAMRHTHISVKAASPKQEPELAALRAVDGPCGAITKSRRSAICSGSITGESAHLVTLCNNNRLSAPASMWHPHNRGLRGDQNVDRAGHRRCR